jgi:hypothetical protein
MSKQDTEKSDILQAMQLQREQLLAMDGVDPIAQIEIIYQLWWKWADFHIFITTPVVPSQEIPTVIYPALLENSDEYEYVYPIMDYGDRLSTSKGLEMYSAGLSMWKLYCTIEKMIALLIERLVSGGATTESEIQVAFAGHELAQRKGFESVINLSYNVVVTNFDPGVWGEHYLQNVKRLADKGYGYPPSSPRDSYRRGHAKGGGPSR